MNIGVSTSGRSAVGQHVVHVRRWVSVAALCFALAGTAGLGVAGVATAAQGATADTPLQVTINGKPMTASGPQVSATLLYRGTDQWLLTVVSASSNDVSDDITAVDGAIDQAARQKGIIVNVVAAQAANPGDTIVESSQNGISLTFTDAPVNVCYQPSSPQASFTCPTIYAAFGPGSTEEYVLTTNDTDKNLLPLSSIDVQMRIGTCPGQTHARRLASADDADCPLPGTTTITKANVQSEAGKASFSYKAAHAKTYVCELLSRNRVQRRTSCTGAKTYAGLRRGTYFFLVWGVNQAGVAKKVTVYGFKVG